jgi:hypothetical protein
VNGDKNIIEFFEKKSEGISIEESIEIGEDSNVIESVDRNSLLYKGDEEADEGCGFISLTKLESNCSK